MMRRNKVTQESGQKRIGVERSELLAGDTSVLHPCAKDVCLGDV